MIKTTTFIRSSLLKIIGSLLLVGCSGPSPPAESEEPLLALLEAESIRITDEWNGLSPLAPIAAVWDLHRTQDGFTGVATFSVRTRQIEANVLVPFESMEDFLGRLSESPSVEGEYVPLIEHTDDYPFISIDITTDGETVTFFTQSQGEDHVPWGLKLGQETHVVPSDTPARALDILEPHLRKDRLNALVNRRR